MSAKHKKMYDSLAVDILTMKGIQLVNVLKQLDFHDLLEYFELLGITYKGKTGYIPIFFEILNKLVDTGVPLSNGDIKDFIELTSTETQTLRKIYDYLNFFNTEDEATLIH